MEYILNDAWTPIVGAFVMIMLSIIGFFLSRLLTQFDQLNTTMAKIDRDLNMEVGVLKVKLDDVQRTVVGLDPVWDRLRDTENKITALENGGCSQIRRCQA